MPDSGEAGFLRPGHPKDLDVLDATFARPNPTTFTRLDSLGVEAIGSRLEPVPTPAAQHHARRY